MTAIAWDGKTLAADRRITSNYSIGTPVTKIFRSGNDELIACYGPLALSLAIKDWYLNDLLPENFPAFDAEYSPGILVIRKGRTNLEYLRFPYPIHYKFKDHLSGGGAHESVMALLRAGLPSESAVYYASQVNAFCGDGIDALTFED